MEIPLHDVRTKVWRAVEAQHRVSTLRLVDNDVASHETLEDILEAAKPALPKSAERLHYLLATPFRYPSPRGSRFRAPLDPGVFYGAVERRTACAELGYWRWRFLKASEGLREIGAAAHTLFQSGVVGAAVDLTRAPLARRRKEWTDPDDYSATQKVARRAREARAELLLYESVRDPEHALCAAVFEASALKPSRPLAQETWFLTVTQEGAIWTREKVHLDFRFAMK
jgi:hypothetical protein